MGAGLEIGSAFAGYRVDDLIGAGGMGAVYLATPIDGGPPVALKVVAEQFAGDDAFRARFAREVRLAAAVGHPNAIALLDSGEQDGRLYLAMNLVQGTDLATVIATEERIHPRHLEPLLAQVASALDAAHAHGLVHRDVKPANVLLELRGDRPHVYLTDFGLSKMVSSTSGLTKTGRWVGTVDYASPEQIEGRTTDTRSDVYSLGCVAYEALTGQVPFPRTREVMKIVAHLSEPPPSLASATADIPALEAIDPVIGRALAKKPDDRHPSAGELARAFTQAVASLPAPGSALQIGPDDRRDGPIDRSAPTLG